jgi:hypothetical protein
MASLHVELENTSGLSTDKFEMFCEEIFNRIVERTPVDTGACQAAWEISFESDSLCIIYNDTPYVSFLEDGHSKQAPNGMVAKTLAELPQITAQIS